MLDEAARSQPGFDSLPDIDYGQGTSSQPDRPTSQTNTPIQNIPPSQPGTSGTGTNPWGFRAGDLLPTTLRRNIYQTNNPPANNQPPVNILPQINNPPLVNNPPPINNLPPVNNPPPVNNQPPVNNPPNQGLSNDHLAALRICLPNLRGLDDDIMRQMDPAVLVQLNAGAQPVTTAVPDIQSAAAMAAAVAAHFSSQNATKTSDPGIKMARTLEKLRLNPVAVPAGLDDRISILHDVRFYPGTVCPSKKQWLEARKRLGMDGSEPLATYDMATAGLGGSVTNQGWIHLASPGSSGLCLKQFSSTNIGNTAGFSRRFSLADGESAVNISDDLKEIADIKGLRNAMRTMTYAARHVMHWNHSFPALHHFLEGNDYGAIELANSTNRISEMVNFVNHVLGVNAQNWIQEEPFLSAPDLAKEFTIWLQSRPSSAAFVPDNHSAKTTYQNQNNNRGWQRGRGGNSNNLGGGHSGQYTAGGGGGQYNAGGGGTGGQYNSGQQKQPFQPGSSRGGTSSRARIICRRYNAGTCTNHYARCRLPVSDDKAWHICNVLSNGIPCEGYHPAFQHNRNDITTGINLYFIYGTTGT
jgi:hypothetical protein